MLRIVGQGDNKALPHDRESLFYLNMAQLPAIPKQMMNKNHLGLIFVTRISFLYRPPGLSGTYLDAMRHLKWTVSQRNGKRVLSAVNDSFYYIPLMQVSLKVNGKTYTPKNQRHMVPPKGSTDVVLMDIPAKTFSNAMQKATVVYGVQTDFGGIAQFNGSLLKPSAAQSNVKQGI
jgi:P pilus assembly chaperone PapD